LTCTQMREAKADITLASSSQEIEIVRVLWREYWDSLGFPPGFQNFEEEWKSLPGCYALPKGRLLLASIEGAPAGTVALRPLEAGSREAKRLYVPPAYRGAGIARALLTRLIAEARAEGYREMYGDTLASMREARGLYHQIGFSEIPPYSANPHPGAIHMRLSL